MVEIVPGTETAECGAALDDAQRTMERRALRGLVPPTGIVKMVESGMVETFF